MRHRTVSSTFGRSTAHRHAMLTSLVCSLIGEKRIQTTLPKAKSARRLAEQMVTLAKDGRLAARRKALSVLRQKNAVNILFNEIAPKCQDRSGGYIRIVKLGHREGDDSAMAIMEWVSISPVDKKKKPVPKDEKPKDKVT